MEEALEKYHLTLLKGMLEYQNTKYYSLPEESALRSVLWELRVQIQATISWQKKYDAARTLDSDVTYPEVIKRWRDEMGRNLQDAACFCRPQHRVKVDQARLPYREET